MKLALYITVSIIKHVSHCSNDDGTREEKPMQDDEKVGHYVPFFLQILSFFLKKCLFQRKSFLSQKKCS